MSLPIEAKKYLKVLVEQSLLQFFVVVRVRESKQLFIKVSRASPSISLPSPPPSHYYPPPHLTTILPISLLSSPSHYPPHLHLTTLPPPPLHQVHNFQLGVPQLEVDCPPVVTVGRVVRVRVKFHNVLLCSLSRVLFLIQGQSLLPQRELSHK